MLIHCDAILFDLDGVLANSIPVIERVWRKWTSEQGINYEELVAVSHGVRAVDTIRRFAPWLDAEYESARLLALEALDMEGVVPIPGVLDFVRSLPADAWAVATSGGRQLATARLQHVGVPVPAVLVSADDVQRGKPHPDPYLLAAQRLGVNPQRCLVFEDAPAGITAGKAAGARVVGLLTTHAAYEVAHADYVVRHHEDVRRIVLTEQTGQPGEIEHGRLTIQLHL